MTPWFSCISSYAVKKKHNNLSTATPLFGCQLEWNAVRPVLFPSSPPEHPQLSPILCLRMMLRLVQTACFFILALFHFFSIKLSPFYFFFHFLCFVHSSTIPILPLPPPHTHIHTYALINLNLCDIPHPKCTHLSPNHTSIHAISDSPSSGQLSERSLEL